jgi:type II restriction enzyme
MLSKIQITEIETILQNALRNKFQHHNPEPAYMPFHTRLLGKDRLALYAFIHSLNTNFGTAIFEPVALALGKANFKTAKSQTVAGEFISRVGVEMRSEIDEYFKKFSLSQVANQKREIENKCRE